MKARLVAVLSLLILFFAFNAYAQEDTFPDGTPINSWFNKKKYTVKSELGKEFKVTDYGVVNDSTIVQTVAIQAVIDKAAEEGGGVVVIPTGCTVMSGSLFFRQGVNLYVENGGKLKGSADISDFPVVTTRIEGQTCKYFAALINADSLDGFKMSGGGIIDGNGLNYWKAFWLRRSWNSQCTNKDEQRPRLVYLSNCKNAEISRLTLQNSPFWTTHIYKCDHIRLFYLNILSPAAPVKAPSTDAIDIDACSYVHVRGCYMSVNDDAIAIKGGKGPWADQDPNNGKNEFIIIEKCKYGFCHGCITFGSECIHARNIILRHIKVDEATRLLWLKMRPDTPQKYEYIRVDHITGNVKYFIFVKPWTQFFDLQGRTDMPLSYGEHITMSDITMKCNSFFEVERSDQYRLSDFLFKNLDITADNASYDKSRIDNFEMKNVKLNGVNLN